MIQLLKCNMFKAILFMALLVTVFALNKNYVSAEEETTTDDTATETNTVANHDLTLEYDTWLTTGDIDMQPYYYKVVVDKTGFITLEYEADFNYYGSTVTLCDSNKEALTEDSSISTMSGAKAFTVKAGTYYFKLVTNCYEIKLKYNTTAVTDQSGSSKSKASTLTVGKAKKGLAFLSDKTSKNDWFKFKLTKATKLNLIVTGNVTAGYIRYELTSPSIEGSLKGYIGDYGSYETVPLKYTKNYILHESLPKGTYYIRFYKDSSKTCGNYTVKVAKR